jgi:hypothetical protein
MIPFESGTGGKNSFTKLDDDGATTALLLREELLLTYRDQSCQQQFLVKQLQLVYLLTQHGEYGLALIGALDM